MERADEPVTLRWARPDDLDALYDVCLRTGDAGHDATDLLDDGRLYGHLYAAPYLVFEPELALVAEHEGATRGYALAARDTASFEALLETDWWPALRAQHPQTDSGTAIDRRLVAQLHDPLRTPASVTDRYPAHLHIDLLPALQGHGVGRRMIDTLLHRLREVGATGVHLGVDPRNTQAIGFYEHLGFTRHGDERVVLFTKRL